MKTLFALSALLAAVSAVPVVIEGLVLEEDTTQLEERQAPFEVQIQAPWDSGAVKEFRIHSSCNASQALQIRTGLHETMLLAQHAKEHVLRWHNESAVYRKYFGNNAAHEVIGAYDIVVNGDRTHALFRCDDPDGNCANNPSKQRESNLQDVANI